MTRNKWFGLCIIVALASCGQAARDIRLPILGNYDVIEGDTIRHSIPDFRFINQDSVWITNETFAGRVYVADFFFTSCPSICPIVKKQMLRLYEKYKKDDRISLVSHSIDTRRDSVPVLRLYAENLGVTSNKWHFVTGDRDALYDIANDYFVSAIEDPTAPGGFDHSGRLILVDKNRHVRAFCNGTEEDDVTRFMEQIDTLLRREYSPGG